MMRAIQKPLRCKCAAALALSICFFAATPAAAQQGPATVPIPLPAPASTVADEANSSSIWAGFDLSSDSHAFFLGAIHALNGDLSADGFLVRGGITIGEYDQVAPGGETDVSFQSGSLLVGYQHAIGAGHIAFFAGPDFSHIGNGASPDVRGSSWGVRGIADFSLPVSPRFELNGWGTYSTIESQYFVQGRALYRSPNRFSIGPEAAVLGGDTWKQHRLGAHAAVAIPIGQIGVSAGHAWNRDSDSDDGAYLSAILSIGF